MLITSFLVGFTISLNRYAVDKTAKIEKPAVLYISELLLSCVFGVLTGLCVSVINNSFEILIVASAVGSYLGKKAMNIICKILLSLLNSSAKQIVNLTDDDFKAEEGKNTEKDKSE